MSTERRSRFSQAVRELALPDAAVAHYSLQTALVELERARKTVAELRAALESACRYLDKAEADDLMQGCAIRPQTAAMKYRTLLTRLDAEGK